MARTNAYILSSTDLMSIEAAMQSKRMLAQVKKTKVQMTAILFTALKNIEGMAVKHGVSQFESIKPKKVDRILLKLAKRAYKQYETFVREGATLRQQKQFVKLFSRDLNLKVIKAAAKSASK